MLRSQSRIEGSLPVEGFVAVQDPNNIFGQARENLRVVSMSESFNIFFDDSFAWGHDFVDLGIHDALFLPNVAVGSGAWWGGLLFTIRLRQYWGASSFGRRQTYQNPSFGRVVGPHPVPPQPGRVSNQGRELLHQWSARFRPIAHLAKPPSPPEP